MNRYIIYYKLINNEYQLCVGAVNFIRTDKRERLSTIIKKVLNKEYYINKDATHFAIGVASSIIGEPDNHLITDKIELI